jgi:oligoribonuclease NrnB/cAMP/cGMP phosphodiesterase (DHH superfamily)
MKCLYHIDEDGRASAFWVRKLARHYDGYEQELIPINYGMEFPFESIQKDEQIYIVDYSIMPKEMERLLEITKDITWLDHHASAIKRYENFDCSRIKGLRYDGIAGCMLTYCYLKHMTDGGVGEVKEFDISMTKDAPMFTKYIADFDVWKFEYTSTKAFEMGLQLLDLDPSKHSSFDRMLANNGNMEHDIIENGRILLQYRDNWSKEYCKHKGFEVEFEGYKCFAINLAMVTSDNFNSVDQDKYDIFIGFSFDGTSWSYSLRSTKVNVFEIAMKYGGGGHPGAAGFNTDELILKTN